MALNYQEKRVWAGTRSWLTHDLLIRSARYPRLTAVQLRNESQENMRKHLPIAWRKSHEARNDFIKEKNHHTDTSRLRVTKTILGTCGIALESNVMASYHETGDLRLSAIGGIAEMDEYFDRIKFGNRQMPDASFLDYPELRDAIKADASWNRAENGGIATTLQVLGGLAVLALKEQAKTGLLLPTPGMSGDHVTRWEPPLHHARS